MKKCSQLGMVIIIASILLIAIVASLLLSSSPTPQRKPIIFCSSIDATNRIALFVLTNTTTQDWSFQLNVVRGELKSSYFITPERKGFPGWGAEFEEGIYCSGYLYRRDSSGRYLPPEVLASPAHVTAKSTNVVLRPKQTLSFSVPNGEISGLSKIGVTCQLVPTSSRFRQVTAGIQMRLKQILNLEPVKPYQVWCEATLSQSPR